MEKLIKRNWNIVWQYGTGRTNKECTTLLTEWTRTLLPLQRYSGISSQYWTKPTHFERPYAIRLRRTRSSRCTVVRAVRSMRKGTIPLLRKNIPESRGRKNNGRWMPSILGKYGVHRACSFTFRTREY